MQSGLDKKLTKEASGWLASLGCHLAAKRIQVNWNSRLQTTAGTACLNNTRIELNPRLADIGEHQVQRTLRHEVAHIVAFARAGRRARQLQTHGPEWRMACAELGIKDEPAFHDLPFARRTLVRKFVYQCPSCNLIVRRVRKFARFTACYHCCKKYNQGIYHPKFKFRVLEDELCGGED
jgi:predicted SprT family Zn-dependent metalloprotease